MSGTPGNTRTLYLGVQSGKGTAQDTPTLKLRPRDVGLDPGRQIITLEECDSAAQDGENVVVGNQPGGPIAAYLRPSEADLLLLALLGSNADSGSDPNYTHTITPTQEGPYLTVFDVIPGVHTTKYVDCRAHAGTFRGGAGGVLEVTDLQIAALTAELGATAPSTPSAAVAEQPLTYPMVTVTKGGSTAAVVDQFSLTIDRGGSRIEGDVGYQSYDYVYGKLRVFGTLNLLFENDDDLRAFNTGSTSGTTPGATIAEEALNIIAALNANRSVAFDMDAVQYTSYPVPVLLSGEPIRVSAGFRTKPDLAAVADNITAIVKNGKATPTT